jgi:hypothetical protein
MGFGKSGADGITMSICNSIWHLFGLTIFNLASVPGGRFSNSPPSLSPVRWA